MMSFPSWPGARACARTPGRRRLRLYSVFAVTVAVLAVAVAIAVLAVAVLSVLAVLAVLLLGDRAQHRQVDGGSDLVLALDGAVEELAQEGASDPGHQAHHDREDERQVLRRTDRRSLAGGQLADGHVGDLVLVERGGDARFLGLLAVPEVGLR